VKEGKFHLFPISHSITRFIHFPLRTLKKPTAVFIISSNNKNITTPIKGKCRTSLAKSAIGSPINQTPPKSIASANFVSPPLRRIPLTVWRLNVLNGKINAYAKITKVVILRVSPETPYIIAKNLLPLAKTSAKTNEITGMILCTIFAQS